MSKEEAKADLTSQPDTIAVSEDSKSALEITVAAAEIEKSADSKELLPEESPAADEADTSLSPETTSSDLSAEEDLPGESHDADLASSSKDASSKDEATSKETVSRVRFASQVTEIAPSVTSEGSEESGDNAVVGDSAVGGTSGESSVVSAITEGSENSVERSAEIPNRGCCPEHRGIIGYFRISMMYLRESKYLLPFQFLLLSMPVSCGFMGSKYMEKCPASSSIPLLLFMIGVLGTVVICARIYSIFKKALFPHSDWSGQVRSALVAAILMLVILYSAELACFFNAKPTFTHGSDDYCHETFYYFVAYMNYISIVLVIILLLLHCPGTNLCAAIRNPELLEN